MHPTTQAMLQAISEANDDNEMRPAECWSHAGQAILAWRQAGKPDLERKPIDYKARRQAAMSAMYRQVYVSTALRTPAGRERLAQAILGRIRYGGPALPEVAIEVTQLAHAVIARSGEDQTEGVRGLIDWLQEAA